MADLSAPVAPPALSTGDVYAQCILPESPALLALFQARGTRQDPPMRPRKPPVSSCLRKMSAYNGGYLASEEEDAESRSRYAKKRLSFADQHGGQLVLEREFRARDAPIYCNSAITYALPPPEMLSRHRKAVSKWQAHSSVVQRLLRGAMGFGRRGSEEQTSVWSQPELLSLCVLSCSVVGCVVMTMARTAHPTR